MSPAHEPPLNDAPPTHPDADQALPLDRGQEQSDAEGAGTLDPRARGMSRRSILIGGGAVVLAGAGVVASQVDVDGGPADDGGRWGLDGGGATGTGGFLDSVSGGTA